MIARRPPPPPPTPLEFVGGDVAPLPGVLLALSVVAVLALGSVDVDSGLADWLLVLLALLSYTAMLR